MNKWKSILNSLSLSKLEKQVAEKFEKQPGGRGFLPLADIFFKHGFVDEGIELLTEGLSQHQNYNVARVVLSKHLYEKGMFVTSWNTLVVKQAELKDNFLAQVLQLKLSIILEMEAVTRRIFDNMEMFRLIDGEVTELRDLYFSQSPKVARDFLLNSYDMEFVELAGMGTKVNLQDSYSVPVFEEKKDFDRYSSFHVVPLSEIIAPGDQGDEKEVIGGVELDSSTLADIYEKQGHFKRALEIYRRLSRLSPNSDLIRNKLLDLERKVRENHQTDTSFDLEVASDLEQISEIDDKINFLEGLLDKLGRAQLD